MLSGVVRNFCYIKIKHSAYINNWEETYILESVAQRNAAWSTVNLVFNGSANWKNTAGMKDQFMCHSYFAKSKNPWNLEPWRPNVGYAETVKKRCNP